MAIQDAYADFRQKNILPEPEELKNAYFRKLNPDFIEGNKEPDFWEEYEKYIKIDEEMAARKIAAFWVANS